MGARDAGRRSRSLPLRPARVHGVGEAEVREIDKALNAEIGPQAILRGVLRFHDGLALPVRIHGLLWDQWSPVSLDSETEWATWRACYGTRRHTLFVKVSASSFPSGPARVARRGAPRARGSAPSRPPTARRSRGQP